MLTDEFLKLRGSVDIKVWGPDGSLKEDRFIPNLVVQAGKNYIATRMIGTSNATAVATTNSISMATTLPTYFTFTGDGSTTTFTLSNITSSTASDYQVSVEGIIQAPDSSYTISSTNQNILFSEAPPLNGIIVVVKSGGELVAAVVNDCELVGTIVVAISDGTHFKIELFNIKNIYRKHFSKKF